MKTMLLGVLAILVAGVGAIASAHPPAALPTRAELLDQLEARADVHREMIGRDPAGLFQCGIRVLGRDGRTIRAWLSCGDYRTGPHAAMMTGSSRAAVVRLDRDGDVTRVRFPPRSLQEPGNIRTIPSAAALLHRAEDTAPRPPGAR